MALNGTLEEGQDMRRRLVGRCGLVLASILGFVLAISGVALAAGANIVNYEDVALSGGFQTGHFNDVWDLTKGDLTISFTYDANGLVDKATAHAWAELGIREIGAPDFNPNGKGVWLATDYDWADGTFAPDPPGNPSLDLDDKLALQKTSGRAEVDYDLPSAPTSSGNNHRFWWDRDGVDPYQNPETANTGGLYQIVMTLHATSATTGAAYMTINGLEQGFETDGIWSTIELTPAGMTFGGDMTKMQVFYGLYGYGDAHSVAFKNICVVGTLKSGTVTVNLLDSKGSGLSGGDVYYYWGGGWQFLGTTDGLGLVSGEVPGKTDVEIRYAGGKYKWSGVDPKTEPALTISTVLVTVKLETCGGTPLVGQAQYYWGGPVVIGGTPVTIELLPYSALGPGQGNYDFRMTCEGRTSGWKTQDISVDPVVVFKTTKVYLFGSNVLYYNNGAWQSFAGPKEMLGGTDKYGNTAWCDFKFDGFSSPTLRMNIVGCSLAGGFIQLVDEEGDPLANYPADYPAEQRNLKYKYRYGGSWAPEVSFKTDANGRAFVSIAPEHLAKWDKKITVTLNQTTKEQDVTLNPVFQAAKVNVNLKSCTGPITGAPGGKVDQGGGFWYAHGTTAPTGTLSFYTFPGNIKVRMSYNHHNQTLLPTVVAGVNNVDFSTTAVTLTYPGNIRSNMGGSWWFFDKPTMYLLPGTYNFWFQSGSSWTGPVEIDVKGCELVYPLTPVNEPPVAAAGGPYAVDEGTSVQLDASASFDADGAIVAYEWDSNGDGVFDDATGATTQVTYPDNGIYVVTVRVTDDAGATAIATATVTVRNVAPILGDISGPSECVCVNTSVTLNASFSDPGVLDTHTAIWEWGDGITSAGVVTETDSSGSVSGSHAYAKAGIYTVKLTVTDKDGDGAVASWEYVIVYDPRGGCLVSLGRFNSPLGAIPGSTVTGPVPFTFNCGYSSKSGKPTGLAAFSFPGRNLGWAVRGFDWMVVSGSVAYCQGTCQINGKAGYSFLVAAQDGRLNAQDRQNRIRVRIWNTATGTVIYDTQPGASLGAPPALPLNCGIGLICICK